MTKSFFLLLLFLSVSSCLPTPAACGSEKMPLPPIFFSAKTIGIVNDSGKSEFGDSAYDELKKWGRYGIVQDPNIADLLLVITANEHYVGTMQFGTSNTGVSVIDLGTLSTGNATTSSSGTAIPITSETTYMLFLDRKTGNRVWSDSRPSGVFTSATRQIIKDIRKRVESAPKRSALLLGGEITSGSQAPGNNSTPEPVNLSSLKRLAVLDESDNQNDSAVLSCVAQKLTENGFQVQKEAASADAIIRITTNIPSGSSRVLLGKNPSGRMIVESNGFAIWSGSNKYKKATTIWGAGSDIPCGIANGLVKKFVDSTNKAKKKPNQ